MAVVFEGKTVCGICGCAVQPDDAIVAFPAFLREPHKLARFSDAAFHRHCFDESKEAAEVLRLYEKYRAIWNSRPADLRDLKAIEAWGKRAFKDFPGDG